MTLELAVDSVATARAAIPFADRIELCIDLGSHGRTPTPELIAAVRNAIDAERPIGGAPELVVLVRPTPSLVVEGEGVDRMVEEVRASVASGADAVAVGVLDADGRVDVAACRRLGSAAGSRSLVFHRAFDFAADAGES
ncbi:MAG: hypothetical protein KDA22_11750, partial [Phycisphaerales bacterium]|nr:hypothetical protein [Phycisphaerales bacterium]